MKPKVVIKVMAVVQAVELLQLVLVLV